MRETTEPKKMDDTFLSPNDGNPPEGRTIEVWHGGEIIKGYKADGSWHAEDGKSITIEGWRTFEKPKHGRTPQEEARHNTQRNAVDGRREPDAKAEAAAREADARREAESQTDAKRNAVAEGKGNNRVHTERAQAKDGAQTQRSAPDKAQEPDKHFERANPPDQHHDGRRKR